MVRKFVTARKTLREQYNTPARRIQKFREYVWDDNHDLKTHLLRMRMMWEDVKDLEDGVDEQEGN